ncbi:MAG: polymerase sigma-E factor [Verrucomicrobiota bacterium]|jgi:RNA polymerase sigma factor (sigma-70 family)
MSGPESIAPEWIERVRAREPAASRELVEQLQPLVLRIVRAHRPWRMAEEDLCQEVFMRVFASLGQYRGAVPFHHWVSRVAVNTCIDQLRRQRARPELRWADLDASTARAVEALGNPAGEDSAAETVALRDLLDQVLATLPPRDRLILQLTALEQRSLQEVSALTGWSQTLIKVRAFRARRRLRQALEQLQREEGG